MNCCTVVRSYYLWTCLCVTIFGTGPGLQAQSNLVYNGSFEAVFDGWAGYNFVIHVNEAGAVDGRNYVDLYAGGNLWQDVPTVSNRSYIVKFATSVFQNDIQVFWGGALIGEANFVGVPWQQWFYTNFVGTATSSVTRVEFREVTGKSTFDNVSVGWRDEPPTIINQVPSRSTFEGGTVTFPIVPSGGPPLSYQWYRNDIPISDGTNRILIVTNAQQEASGQYVVTITNAFGQVSSLPATLVVQPIPSAPLIVYQPKKLQITAGYYAGFYVFAVGAPPLRYRWRFNAADIPGATDSQFSISTVAMTDSGDYSVVVSNDFGCAESLPANLSVVTGYGGGVVIGDNINPPYVDAPIFDVDGVTALMGANYSAQLYAGATSNSLHAVGLSATFADAPGYYFTGAVPIPDVPAGMSACVQVRVWDNNFGSTFEQARTLGGRFGKSDILSVLLQGPPPFPTPLTGLMSFGLQAGQPLLATAKLYPGGTAPDGNLQWLLVGDTGTQYVVERQIPPSSWSAILVVTNLTGTVTFVDTNAPNSSMSFYRARILEQ